MLREDGRPCSTFHFSLLRGLGPSPSGQRTLEQHGFELPGPLKCGFSSRVNSAGLHALRMWNRGYWGPTVKSLMDFRLRWGRVVGAPAPRCPRVTGIQIPESEPQTSPLIPLANRKAVCRSGHPVTTGKHRIPSSGFQVNSLLFSGDLDAGMNWFSNLTAQPGKVAVLSLQLLSCSFGSLC